MSHDERTVGKQFLETTTATLQRMKAQAEKAMAQVGDDSRLYSALDPESNSIAVLIRHLSGNMRSRWSDFLTTDGEKPTRDRDGEFEPTRLGRAELMAEWESGWACLFQALAALTPANLGDPVRISGKEMPALEAIVRQFEHYASHAGQIVLLAKHLSGERWQAITVPRRRPSRA